MAISESWNGAADEAKGDFSWGPSLVGGTAQPLGVRTHTTSVVIPTLNEAKNIAWVLERLPDFIDEVILVDGRSTDDTIAVARAARPDVVVVLEQTPGKGAALRAGFRAARGDFIVMLDADGSMDPGEIPSYVDALENGWDLIKGSRFMPGGGSVDITPLRRLGNACLLSFVNLLYRCRFTELCYGFFAFRRCHLGVLALRADGFEIETELVVRALREDLRIAEVPSLELERLSGRSNLRPFRDGKRVLRKLIVARFSSHGRAVIDLTGGIDLTERVNLIDLTATHLAVLPGEASP